MDPSRVLFLRRVLVTVGMACALVSALRPADASANTGRLLTMDAAETLEAPVLGLQRSALPLGLGFALDTSLYADLLLTPNLGLRYAVALPVGPVFVLGARYTHFVGQSPLSSFLRSRQPVVQRFDAEYSGPTFYGVLGWDLGPLVAQVEARYSAIGNPYTSLTGGLRVRLPGSGFSLVGEVGTRFSAYSAFRAAAGFRYAGDHLGVALGIAYVDLVDPLLPGGKLPVLPTFDLSWTF